MSPTIFDHITKFNNGEKLHLIRLNKKDDIIKLMQALAAYLRVELYDNTET